MPFTFNGIGTRYAGRANASARNGQCEFCKRQTTLTSYDTREFFCIIYIPLIPITQYRIFDECASCRKHRRIAMKEFKKDIAQHVQPLRDEVRRSPQKPESHLALIQSLLGFRMNAEAEEAARRALATLPNDPQLNVLTGQILSSKGDLGGAATFLKRGTAVEPGNAAGRLSLGRVLYLKRDWSGAVVELAEARRLTGDPAASYLLADAYEQMQRWPDALPVWQQLAATGADKELVRRIAFCKEKMGYQLSDVERKASRRWWPFGRRGPRPVATTSPAKVGGGTSKIVIYGGGFLVAITLLSFGTMAYMNLTRVDVWLDSAILRSRFTVDGESVQGDTLPIRKELSFGRHAVAAFDRSGRKLDERTIDVARPGLFDNLMGNRAYVYNAGGARVYRRLVIVYSTSPSGTPPQVTYIAGEPFFAVDGADYVFQAPPHQIEMSSGSSSTTKVAFAAEPGLTLSDYAMMQADEGRFGEAEKMLRTAIRFDACDPAARQRLVGLLLYTKKNAEATTAGVEGVRDCGSVESHRSYQSVLRATGAMDRAVSEYSSLAASHPGSAMYQYLYGRVLPDETTAEAAFRKAAQLDPNFGWAHAALGYVTLASGRYDEAMAEIAAALRHDVTDENYVLLYAYSAIAAGKANQAQPLVNSFARPPMPETVWDARFALALAQQNWTAAKSMIAEREKQEMSPGSWLVRAQLCEAMDDDAALARHIESAKREKALAAPVAIVSFERLLTNGDYTGAASLIDGTSKTIGEPGLLLQLYGAAGMMIAGDPANATARLQKARADISAARDLSGESRKQLETFAAALAGQEDENAAISAVRHDDLLQLKHLYFFLAARSRFSGNAVHARELFAKSAETSFDMGFPRAAAKKLAVS